MNKKIYYIIPKIASVAIFLGIINFILTNKKEIILNFY